MDGVELTTDVGPEVRLQLRKEEAEQFYMKPCNIINGVNRGGLGWSSQRFHAVAWTTIESALMSKPDMFQLWLSKQWIGICTTRRNMAHIQDILDDNAQIATNHARLAITSTNILKQDAHCSSTTAWQTLLVG
jgi:hypothetical protein